MPQGSMRCPVLCMFVFFFIFAAAGQSPKSGTGSRAQSSTSRSAAVSMRPSALIRTTAGDMKCELFPDLAPKAVANFIGLAKGTKDWTNPTSRRTEHNRPLYDGVIFHRVIPKFMIQGGDPSGSGSGDVGFKFEDELHPDLLFDKPGRLAMANSGPNTNSSQFFITEQAVPFLNPCFRDGGCPELGRGQGAGYTIFGQCDDNTVELVKKIARMPRGAEDRPTDPVKIRHVEILNVHQPADTKKLGSEAGHKAPPASH